MQTPTQFTPVDDERYKLLIDAITDYAIYMLDPEGRVSSWNPGAQRSKGYTEQEILGQHFSRFYTEEDRSNGLPERALNLAETEGRFENEGWRLRKDGTRFWAHVVIDPIWSPSRTLLGFAKVTRDLTERKRAELELATSEQQFQLLVQGVVDYAIFMLNPNGRVASWNSGAERIKGYTSGEIIGSHFSQFYTEEDRAAGLPEQGLQTALREGRFEKEGIRLRKDGSRFWAHVVIDPIRDETGHLVGFAKVTRDITEKLEAQKALVQTREELFQAQKMEAIGQLTGGIAHDFNNLLMAVLGSLSILKKRMPDEPSLVPLLDNAIQGADRGVALIQRMLAYSRKQDLNIGPVNISRTVSDIMDFVPRTVGSTIHVATDIPPDLPAVVTDGVQLETALLNLTVNARDAMPNGGAITIHARRAGEPHMEGPQFVELSVTDTGEGMDEATVLQATTPFFTTKGVGKGTGLGLSMVQGLAEQSGGRLTIESRQGAGTTISLILPVSEEAHVPAPLQNIDHSDEVKGMPQSLAVLAVDDDALVLMNTTLMLEDLGHKVTEAYNGSEALQLIKDGARIDLVITDHSMPQMTGAELAAQIQGSWPEIPVVLATGYAELPSGEGTQLPKLSKPFSQEQLRDVIAAVVRS